MSAVTTRIPRTPTVSYTRRPSPVVLADFGSTYTKVTVVDERDGRLIGTARHRTTVDSDVLNGLDAAIATLEADLPTIGDAPILACSSAGGGLRVAVIGLERDLTAEAARVAALSAGAKVDTVLAGRDISVTSLEANPPDIILLTGGTDGGDSNAIVTASEAIAASAVDVPIVVAGNREVSMRAQTILSAAGRRVTAVANVMPDIGVLEGDEAREAIREQFLRHVIGGKHLSGGARFGDMVRMATPDAVLRGAELAAEGTLRHAGVGPIVVLDVGGATTDVHSVVGHQPGTDGMERPVLPQPVVARTVEGDLGLRWNALGIVEVAQADGLLSANEAAALTPAAEMRVANPSLDVTESEGAVDLRLAGLAARIAMSRHAGRLAVTLSASGASIRREGRDLRDVPMLVATGGVFEHADPAQVAIALAGTMVPDGSRLLPRAASLHIDCRYVLAAVGLLADEYPEQAASLFAQHVARWDEGSRSVSQ